MKSKQLAIDELKQLLDSKKESYNGLTTQYMDLELKYNELLQLRSQLEESLSLFKGKIIIIIKNLNWILKWSYKVNKIR